MLPTENNRDESNSNKTKIPKTANVIAPLFPSVPSTSSSSTELSVCGEESDIYWETHIQHPSGVTIPIKPTLKELLNAANGSNDVENMTSVKLCVISSEICLQHISVYTPNLTELILDGSDISSLRDLGCNLKKLKVLRVNRCHLTCLDGTFGLQELEELHAGHNSISNLNPCAYLPVIRHIDVNNNCLKNISMLSFLNICKDLETLVLAGNTDIVNTPDYRKSVKLLVKNLKNLDGEQLEEVPKDDKNNIGNEEDITDFLPLEFNNNEPSISLMKETVKQRPSSSRKSNSPKEPINQFFVRFPPKVLSPRLPVLNTEELHSASNSAKSKPKNETRLFATTTK